MKTKQRPEATPTLLVDNATVRVTRFNFPPGAETGWHVHAHDYVVVALTDCAMLIENPDGTTRETHVKAHDAYDRPRGVEHNVINNSDHPMAFVEVEIKSDQ